MKSIYEASVAYGREHQGTVNIEDYQAGANYALDAIEEFMDTMNLGSNAAEKFYKLDLMADIHEFIEQLKGNQ